MNISIIGLLALLLLQSCFTAPSNGRKDDSPNKPDLDEQTDNCPTCAVPAIEAIKSQIFRNKGADVLTLDATQKALAQDKLTNIYRTVANPTLDNESHVILYSKTDTLKECGLIDNATTITNKMNHCMVINGSAASWLAKANGNAGERDWQLVTFSKSKGLSLWMDKGTNLIWSHILANQTWEVASGVDAQDDENTFCEELNSKTDNHIAWRLPNRNEFLQADIDGARYVLSDTQNIFWTASSDSKQSNAWSIEQSTGALQSIDKDTALAVRCIGVVIK